MIGMSLKDTRRYKRRTRVDNYMIFYDERMEDANVDIDHFCSSCSLLFTKMTITSIVFFGFYVTLCGTRGIVASLIHKKMKFRKVFRQ